MKKDTSERQKIVRLATCAVFIAFIAILTVVNLLMPKVYFSDNENRALSPGVNTSLNNILFGDFDTEFETWFSDHFMLRDRWIEIKSSVRKDLGAIENNGVYLAHDGRLIQQFLTYDPKTVEDNITYLEEFSEENDIRLNVMLVPGASYGEKGYLPLGAANIDEKKLINEIGEKLKDQNYIDLTEMMGTKENFWFRTDHHWNEAGAYVGYEAICRNVLNKEARSFNYEKVSDDFKGTMYSKSGAFWTKGDPIYRMEPSSPLKVKVSYDSKTESDSLFEDKNLEIKDKYTYYLDGNHAYVHITTDADTDRKALIIKDSYSHILIPYLASEYSEIELVDLRYYHDQVSTLIKDKEKTDVYVIYGIETFATDKNLSVLW